VTTESKGEKKIKLNPIHQHLSAPLSTSFGGAWTRPAKKPTASIVALRYLGALRELLSTVAARRNLVWFERWFIVITVGPTSSIHHMFWVSA
jgi:hypothetical protein